MPTMASGCLKVLLFVIALALVVNWIAQGRWFHIVLAVALVTLIIWQQRQKRIAAEMAAERRRQEAEQSKRNEIGALDDVIASHVGTLMLKRRALIVRDAYGKRHPEKWQAEKQYFIANVLQEDAPAGVGYLGHFEALRRIEEAIDRHEATRGAAAVAQEPLTPHDYEDLCANALISGGGTATRIGGSGDQGVDVLASIDDLTIVVQCKWYGKPVGNSAVQEVVAGRQFYDADKAIVVAPNGFTAGAIALADANGVILTHHADLHRVRELL